MKKGIFGFPLLCFMALLLSITAFAADNGYCGDEGDGTNLAWTLDDSGTLTISGHGMMKDDSSYVCYFRNHRDEIKKVVIENGVTYIGERAFSGCGNITSVEIPQSVLFIGAAAFRDCKALQEITLPNNPNNPLTIGSEAYIRTGIKRLTIPSNTVYIGTAAFAECDNLEDVIIEQNSKLDQIRGAIFRSCHALKRLTIPSGVRDIYGNAFKDCNNLSEITIPNSVVTVGSEAFANCAVLKDIQYNGTEAQWNAINIAEGNSAVISAAQIHYHGDGKPNDGTPGYYVKVEGGYGSGYYREGELVTLTAGVAREYDYHTIVGSDSYPVKNPEQHPFKEWSWDSRKSITFVSGDKNTSTATFQMPGYNMDFWAMFSDNRQKYTVTVINGSGSGSYSYKDAVTIEANPSPDGKRFLRWTGTDGLEFLGKGYDENSPEAEFSMPEHDVTVTATYEGGSETSYVVTVNGGSGSGRHQAGDTVTIRADTPASGKRFKEWSGTDGLTFTSGSALDVNASFTMPNRDVAITATYEDIPRTSYVVTVNQGSGSGSYAQGETVTIVANTPESGKRFKEWTGANSLTFTSGSATTSRATFVMPGDAVTITATYEILLSSTYTVTVNNGSGSGSYSQGDTVTIRANPAPSGKQFKEWSGANGLSFTSGSASSANAAFAMPSRNVTITATYRDESYFDEPIHRAPNLEKLISATSALIHEYEYVADSSDPDDEFASGRLIVDADKTLPDLTQFNVAQIVVTTDLTYLIQFYNAKDAERCARYLDSLSYVSYTEPDGVITADIALNPSFVPQASATYNSWGVTATKSNAYAEFLRNKGVSSNVTVAVVDSGVDSTHPFLNGRVLSGYDLVDDDSTPQDGNSHGTHVSGTIVDCTLGLNIRILPVRVLDNEGSGQFSTVGQGIRYAADHSAKVINLSLGGSHSDYVDSAIAYALSKNVTVVVAAGNEDENTNYHCPAHIQNCITVAAVDSSKTKANFSNHGNAVDIAAPGVAIKSSVPGGGYQNMSGTSMATPHVAAAAAMLLYENGNQTPAQIEKRLRDAAVDLGATGWDQYYGAGFLNLEKFIGISFSDVPTDAYFYKPVRWAIERGITNGTTNTTFSPHEVCTTAQILTFIWRAVGEPEPASSFGISSDLYYSKAMRWASEQGIRGMYATNEANSACTRASAMVYLWGLAGKPAAGNNPFIDVPLGAGYASAISWGVGRGVTNGTTENTFSPLTLCTRAQIITFLYRYYVESVR